MGRFRMKDGEAGSVWYTLLRLAGFVLFHAVVYVYGKRIWLWWKGETKEKRDFDLLEKRRNLLLAQQLRLPSENLSDSEHEDLSEIPSSDDETRFIDTIDKFCKTGTKIQKSKECIKYMRAIQRKVGERLQKLKQVSTTDKSVVE